MRAVKVLCAAAALVAWLAPAAHADEWNKRTYLTFSGPVQVPGATLPAGTYTFEIANPDTTRHVIRVSEKDSGKHVGLFMTIPNDRLDPPNDNLILFSERPAGSPQAIQVWFYPGDRTGEEFVYPKNQAVQIAKANHARVLSTDTSNSDNASEADRMAAMRSASVGRVDEHGQMTKDESKPATTASAQPPASTTTAQSDTSRNRAAGDRNRSNTSDQAGTTGTAGTTASRSARRSLPRTASNLPAVLLLSIFSLGGAYGVHRLRRSTAAQ